MSNKIPKAHAHSYQPDVQSAAMQHQLHLQTIDVLTKLYNNAIEDKNDSVLIDHVRKALVNLLEPFQPTPPPSPVLPVSPVIQ